MTDTNNATTVYGKPHCVQCTGTMRTLDNGGVEYIYVDVSESPESLAYIKELGYLSAPVVVTSDGEHWSGHRPDLIAKHITVA